jgi:hypothetical protein
MDIRKQVVTEIARLNKILALLDDDDDVTPPVKVDGRTKTGRKGRRKLSAAGRASIVKAQRARWAKIRAAKK